MTNRFVGATAGLCVLLLMGTASAAASGLHYNQGKLPVFSATGSTVEASGQVAGAGSSIDASLHVDYTYTVSCFNSGKDAGPVAGQSGSGVTTGDTGPINTTHGNASFDVTTSPANTTGGSCPNGGWTKVAGPVSFTTATLIITSNNGGSLTCIYDFTTNTYTSCPTR